MAQVHLQFEDPAQGPGLFTSHFSLFWEAATEKSFLKGEVEPLTMTEGKEMVVSIPSDATDSLLHWHPGKILTLKSVVEPDNQGYWGIRI